MANNVPSPFESPDLWNTLKLLGSRGTVTIPNVTVNVRGGGLKEDRKDVPGKDGKVSTFLGYDDASVEVTAVADTKAEFDKLKATIELYRNKRDTEPPVVVGVHPNLAMHGITNVYITRLESEDFSRDTGFVLKIYLQEWQSEAVQLTKGTSDINGGKGKKSGTGGSEGGGIPTTPRTQTQQGSRSPQEARANPPSSVVGRASRSVGDGSTLAIQQHNGGVGFISQILGGGR